MQAVVFPAPETITIERLPDPACGPDAVIIQVARSGICGTDLHIYRNEHMSTFPLTPGHEFGGMIDVAPSSAIRCPWPILPPAKRSKFPATGLMIGQILGNGV
jgi:threonine dehydrogenase-like Zn-dependent dehydrogenase